MVDWQAIADRCKSKIWDITDEWLKESKNDLIGNDYLTLSDEEIISHLPTILGGITNAIADPAYVEDFNPGGDIYVCSSDLGRERQQNGYQLEKIIADYALLRQKVWAALAADSLSELSPKNLLELNDRLNNAMDIVIQSTARSFCEAAGSELIELAYRDKLTGFYHFKAFLGNLESEINRAHRYRHPLSLTIFDIDNFTDFNRRYGRFTGNKLLQEVAAGLYQFYRNTDSFARLGGDEFAVITPETDAESALKAGERIRRRIKKEARRREMDATLSVGIAAYPVNADNGEVLLKECRDSLDRARRKGGDNIQTSNKVTA